MKDSLSQHLFIKLLWPLLLLFVVGAYMSYLLASYFSGQTYDRWLNDAAHSLVQQIKHVDGKAAIVLPSEAVQMFEWNGLDQTFYAVTSHERGIIFGKDVFHATNYPVQEKLDVKPLAPRYFDYVISGTPVRAVTFSIPAATGQEGLTIQVAETLVKRNLLTREILFALMVPQALLIIGAILLIRIGINSGVRPLSMLARQIEARRPGDLRPVDDAVPEEVKPLTRSLNTLLRQLEKASSAQQRFIAQAAHQLRTPLSALQVQAESALREPNPASHKEALSRILKATSRLNRLSHQLLTFARAEPEAGASQRLVDVDLVAVAREITSEWVPAALNQNVDLGYNGSDALIMIKGDPLLLRELISNLIDNALQYGGKDKHVTVGVVSMPNIILYVEDDGPGIPVEARNSVLEPFIRLPGSGGQGCGLGLAIVREIAVLHKARVEISTGADNTGTRVFVTFRPDSN